MTIPNLFLIEGDFPSNPYYIIGIDNNSMVLSSDDMGCFSGDCSCCAEDGSDKPVVNIEYNNGIFTYSAENSQLSTFYKKELGFTGVFPTTLIEEEGDISGSVDVEGATPTNIPILGSEPYGCGFIFGISAVNECGGSNSEAKCHCIVCNANYDIDCVTHKIKIIKTLEYEDGVNWNPQYINEYYDLGDVPSISIGYSNGCGSPCSVYETAPCIFNKNSVVLEFSDFSDVINEYYSSGGFEYTKITMSNMSVLNGTLIFPLYIRDCGTISAPPSTSILDYDGAGDSIGYIVYSRPTEIYRGQITVTVNHKKFRADVFGNPTILWYESNSTRTKDIYLDIYNEFIQETVAHSGGWDNFDLGTSGSYGLYPSPSDPINAFISNGYPQEYWVNLGFYIPERIYCEHSTEITYYYNTGSGKMTGYYDNL